MLKQRSFRVIVPLLLILANSASADTRPFTIEQIMSAPFAEHLVAAPAGGKIAWVFNEKGARNIWIAEAPGFKGRRLTSHAEDDGLEITGLDWSADGKSIAFARGGEAIGADPNPLSKPTVPEQTVHLVSVETGQVRALGAGNAPRVAPKGDRVVFLKGGQVWSASLSGNQKAQQLLHMRGTCRTLRWSPDGSRLAFVSERGGHSFIGIYGWETKKIQWLAPSVDNDSEPVWSPDGKSVAFLRIPPDHRLPFTPLRQGQLWSIHRADPETGSERRVWQAKDGAGSVFHGLGSETQLWWGAGDLIVFPWERDGWIHLYSVSINGGLPTPLTPGAFEVEHASMDSTRTRIVYSSNQDDIDRRHVWSVPVARGKPQALTSGAGIEWSPVVTGDGHTVAFLHATGRQPGQPVILTGTERRDVALQSLPAEFPIKELVETQQVIFPAADGLMIHGQLFLPADLRQGERRPAVIFFHGGSRRQMLLGWHYMRYYHNTYAFNQYLASQGYIVLSVNYRSGIGYGMNFREAIDYGAAGASEFNDVQGAGLYLHARPDVDGKRIGLWGGSYGGYLTGLGLARASHLFAAGVDIHGVYDWNAEIRNWVRDYDPRKQEEAARVAYRSSPVADVKNWRSPVLVIHGDDDRNVPFNETAHLVEDLRKQHVHVEQLIFPDEVHDFLTHAHWLRAMNASGDFFNRQLLRSGKP
jgi:dipeptidyl aminopeptidase/acylaminoacyl peptidase